MNIDKDQILQLLRSQGPARPGQPGIDPASITDKLGSIGKML